MKGKRGVEWEVIAPYLIALVFFVIMLGGYLVLTGKLGGFWEFIKNLFRFRR